MIRDVVTRGFSGQGDGLKFVVTAGYAIGSTPPPSGPFRVVPLSGVYKPTRGLTGG